MCIFPAKSIDDKIIKRKKQVRSPADFTIPKSSFKVTKEKNFSSAISVIMKVEKSHT